jgi:hypothetical protein
VDLGEFVNAYKLYRDLVELGYHESDDNVFCELSEMPDYRLTLCRVLRWT